MIDIESERVISLTEAAEHLPRRRGSKKPHVATLYRWASRGLRGVQLESIPIGGTLCTSAEALQRFFERLAELRKPAAEVIVVGPTARQRAARQAECELEKLGF